MVDNEFQERLGEHLKERFLQAALLISTKTGQGMPEAVRAILQVFLIAEFLCSC